MRILIAPDKFRSSLSASLVAEAMARGARKVHPEASFSIRPSADGGEGTLDAFLLAAGGRVREVTASGPLDSPVQARIAVLHDGRAVIEMADAAGLSLVDPDPTSAARAHTYGVGELILAAKEQARSLLLGIGGSASTDGGMGAATAAGWRFLDRSGNELPAGGAALTALDHIEPPQRPLNFDITAVCDVENPLIGMSGAARTFGPQKGADTECVRRLEEGLHRLAEVVRSDIGVDISEVPHGGAGGGMGAGLLAFFGATLRPGLEVLADASGLEADIASADLVITGEGRLDLSSLNGKAPIAVAKLAQRADTPCVAVVGDLQLERQRLKKVGIIDAVGLVQSGAGSLAETDPGKAIERATEGLLRMRQEKSEGRSFRRQRSFRR